MRTTAALSKFRQRRRCRSANKGGRFQPSPLTPEGQALVLAHLDLAHRVAAWQASKTRGMYREYHSAALLGLVEAAARYDASLGVTFKRFAFDRIRGAVLDCYRATRPRGLRRRRPGLRGACEFSLDAPLFSLTGDDEDDVLTLADIVPSPEWPVGWEMESLDEVRVLASRAVGRQRAAVLLRFTQAATVTQEAAGRALGITKSGVSRLLNVAFSWIREGTGHAR